MEPCQLIVNSLVGRNVGIADPGVKALHASVKLASALSHF